MAGRPLTFDAAPDELILFLSEGEEQLELLSQDILRMEQESDTNAELLQEIFRAAHTLKGSSGAIGHTRMARLTHALETVLDHVRHHTLPVTSHLIDLLLQGVDALRALLDEVTTMVEGDVAIDSLVDGLNALAATGGSPGTAPAPAKAPKVAKATPAQAAPVPVAPASAGDGLWQIEIVIADSAVLPGPRALQVQMGLSGIGEIRRSEPDAGTIEAGAVKAGDHVTFWLAPEPGDAATRIRDAVERVMEVTLIAATGDGGAVASADATAQTWQMMVEIAPQCPLPAARALQVILACGEVGTILDNTPTLEEIESGQVAATDPVLVTLTAAGTLDEVTRHIREVVERAPEVTLRSVTNSADPAQHNVVAEATPQLAAAPTPVATPVSAAPAAETAAAPKAESAGEQPHAANAAHAPRMVRIDVERLDALMNLVGELVIDRTRLARIATRISHISNGDPILAEELIETCRHLTRISDDLQDEVMRSRMLPIESVFSKFPRLVRDLAQKVHKKIDFIVEGKDTELDRSVAEQIGDPIIHLLRNSIDHGIEPGDERVKGGKSEAGQVRLAARHEENQIVIDVEDDGKGISPEWIKGKAVSKGILTAEAAARMSTREAVDLIFAPGFSTAEQISDISGRGVGMDIVRTNVERLNGSITVETEVGSGTRFTVRLPLTLAIIRALLVKVEGQTYAVPLTSVVEALHIDRTQLRGVNGREAIELRGQVLPLLRLGEIFADRAERYGATNADQPAEREYVVAVRWGERNCGVIVESLIGEQEIVIKPLGTLFRSATGISGGAVLGDGTVAPILDIAALIKHVISNEREIGQLQGARA
jgi:two-component system, chemotaxis family, sensor kinase CheA